MRVPEWLVRGFTAGLAGTTVMSGTLAAEQRLSDRAARRRPDRQRAGPVDYDASPHVVTAASTVLHWQPKTDAQRRALFVVVHWGYGSAVGIGYDVLRQRLPNRRVAAAVFYVGCQAMAMTLFPTVGGTPPPWKWRRALLVSSLAQHAIYAAVVAKTDDVLCRRAGSSAAS